MILIILLMPNVLLSWHSCLSKVSHQNIVSSYCLHVEWNPFFVLDWCCFSVYSRSCSYGIRDHWSSLLTDVLSFVTLNPTDIDGWKKLLMLPKCILYSPRETFHWHDITRLVKQWIRKWISGVIQLCYSKEKCYTVFLLLTYHYSIPQTVSSHQRIMNSKSREI